MKTTHLQLESSGNVICLDWEDITEVDVTRHVPNNELIDALASLTVAGLAALVAVQS